MSIAELYYLIGKQQVEIEVLKAQLKQIQDQVKAQPQPTEAQPQEA